MRVFFSVLKMKSFRLSHQTRDLPLDPRASGIKRFSPGVSMAYWKKDGRPSRGPSQAPLEGSRGPEFLRLRSSTFWVHASIEDKVLPSESSERGIFC